MYSVKGRRQTIPGCTYRPQYRSSFDESLWKEWPGDIVASDSTVTASDAISETSRFYQLLLSPWRQNRLRWFDSLVRVARKFLLLPRNGEGE